MYLTPVDTAQLRTGMKIASTRVNRITSVFLLFLSAPVLMNAFKTTIAHANSEINAASHGSSSHSSLGSSCNILNLAKQSDPFETPKSLRKIHLHLVRHGETIANANGVLQGHCDYPLTDLGKKQADTCGIYLKDMKWDKVYASDLYRAFDTCQKVLARSEYPDVYNKRSIQRTTLLRELSFGVREGLPRETPFEEAVKHVAKQLNIPEEDVEDNTESKEQVYRRQVKFVSTLLRDLVLENPDSSAGSDDVLVVDARRGRKKTDAVDQSINTSDGDSKESDAPLQILCLSHGGFIKQFLRNFCSSSLTDIPTKIWNCAVTSVTIEWPDPSQPTGFLVTTQQSAVNVNTMEAVARMQALTLAGVAEVAAITATAASSAPVVDASEKR